MNILYNILLYGFAVIGLGVVILFIIDGIFNKDNKKIKRGEEYYKTLK